MYETLQYQKYRNRNVVPTYIGIQTEFTTITKGRYSHNISSYSNIIIVYMMTFLAQL